jgi:hypothetical protein
VKERAKVTFHFSLPATPPLSMFRSRVVGNQAHGCALLFCWSNPPGFAPFVVCRKKETRGSPPFPQRWTPRPKLLAHLGPCSVDELR